MNERIKKLIVECYSPYAHFEQEKFAELLLREAIDIIEEAPTQHCAYTTYDKTVVDCTVQKIIASLHSEFELKKIYKAPQ
jgi:hypothetical protein